MKKIIGSALLFSTLAFAQEIKSPEQVQAELDQAWSDFNTAKEMFIPWYTGPLITGSANNVPKGKWNIQSYLFFIDSYSAYNDNRGLVNMPDIYTINPLLLVQYGLLERLDSTLVIHGLFNWREGKHAHGYGDTTLTFGFQVVKQTPHIPSVRITIGEIFPTGRYQHFDPDKASIEATGQGAYQTQFGLFLNKIFWELKLHPISLRFAGVYTLPDHRVNVRKFNTYGGGFGTDADVRIGDGIQADLGIEVSITQKWVFAFDVAYDYAFATTYTGAPGIIPPGVPATVGGPSNDQLSLAPAIEYNVSSTGGFIGGVWFSVTGRNSAAFASVVLSYTQLF